MIEVRQRLDSQTEETLFEDIDMSRHGYTMIRQSSTMTWSPAYERMSKVELDL